MDYQRRTIPFLHGGMDWNHPAEKVPQGKLVWAKNARVLQQGDITSANGHAFYATVDLASYIHSISRLNLNNTENYDPGLTPTYVVGADREIYAFQNPTILANPALNPLISPQGTQNAFSGNPLSIVDAQPTGAVAAWKYVADSQQMCAVGYYPGDKFGVNMARCIPIGLPPPTTDSVFPSLVIGGVGSGVLTGTYTWSFAFRRVPTGARSNPSAALRPGPPTGPGLNGFVLNGQSVTFNLPPVPNDPQTGAPDTHIVVDVYRFGGSIFRWALVGSAAGGTSFTDQNPDINLLAAPSPPQVTDPTTGLTRFNLFQPFVTQDVEQEGTGNVYLNLSMNTWFFEVVSGAQFNVNWLPGSTINIGSLSFQIYQVVSPTQLEISQNLTGIFSPLAHPFGWTTPAGTLKAGQPVSHMWGVFGVGNQGSYLFGCGDPNNLSTLYWTNGNDPDSTDLVNNIQVTSPSEKLQTGCVYAGQAYCWSTERQFQITPSLTVFGQFTAQEMAGAKGCWLEWSLSVNSNELADLSVTWRGKDGVYDWGVATGLRRLSDDLYPFFPHDNEQSFAPETFINFTYKPEVVGILDDSQPKYHRTCWFQGVLFYDFVAQSTPQGNTFSSLVWDDVQVKGWASLDQPFSDTTKPVARGVEIGPVNNLKVSWGDTIYDYSGAAAILRSFHTRVITRAEDMGDSRLPKLWGDFWLDCTPLSNPGGFVVVPLIAFNNQNLILTTITPSGVRENFPVDFHESIAASGNGILSQTLGLDIDWFALDGTFAAVLNNWEPAYVVKPDYIEFRATDRDDQGANQAKYLMGANIEADTRAPFGAGLAQHIPVNVIVDGTTVAQLTLTHDGQLEIPYAWKPVAGYEFQVQLNLLSPELPWQLYKISWIFEPWPDSVARTYPFMSYGETGAKFIQGIVMPVETGGQAATIALFSDDDNTTRIWIKTTQPLVKTGTVFDLSEPFVAHEIQWSTQTPARIWPGEAKVIWEPIPELTQTWQTQPTDHDLCTWHSLREAYIAVMGGTGIPLFEITDEYGTVQVPLDPLSNNQYTRSYRVLPPMKAKWHSYRVTNPGGVRLFIRDTCVFVKEWGNAGPYIGMHPFGDDSRVSGARI